MYQKYQTEAIVLRSYERGEADRVFALYTKEFGFVWARASAVRRENSRQRYALQNYGLATLGLVRGTSGWRVVGASALAHIESHAARSTKRRGFIVGSLRLSKITAGAVPVSSMQDLNDPTAPVIRQAGSWRDRGREGGRTRPGARTRRVSGRPREWTFAVAPRSSMY